MNAAVVVSGHYRSFSYLADYIKQLYDGCDFYFCFWDHEFRYSIEAPETTVLHRMTNNMREPLDLDYIRNFVWSKFKTPVKFLTLTDMLNFTYSIDGFFHNKEDRYNKYSPTYIVAKGNELLNKDYDIVFRQRPDAYQTLPLPISELIQLIKSVDRETIWSPRLQIKRGFPHFDDTFFFGSKKSMDKLLGNLSYGINNLLQNPMIKRTEAEYFYYHYVLGALTLQNLVDVKLIDGFKNKLVRKKDVDNNTFNL